MQYSLEQCRDAWIDAYYRGDSIQLKSYEHPELQIIYEVKGIVEGNVNRYEQIEHAVQNGVWKPQKPQLDIEEFEFNDANNRCVIHLKQQNNGPFIQETWVFDQVWRVIELRFCREKVVEHS